jgi:hypothetical protein
VPAFVPVQPYLVYGVRAHGERVFAPLPGVAVPSCPGRRCPGGPPAGGCGGRSLAVSPASAVTEGNKYMSGVIGRFTVVV